MEMTAVVEFILDKNSDFLIIFSQRSKKMSEGLTVVESDSSKINKGYLGLVTEFGKIYDSLKMATGDKDGPLASEIHCGPRFCAILKVSARFKPTSNVGGLEKVGEFDGIPVIRSGFAVDAILKEGPRKENVFFDSLDEVVSVDFDEKTVTLTDRRSVIAEEMKNMKELDSPQELVSKYFSQFSRSGAADHAANRKRVPAFFYGFLHGCTLVIMVWLIYFLATYLFGKM